MSTKARNRNSVIPTRSGGKVAASEITVEYPYMK
jgi:hypothetical protein